MSWQRQSNPYGKHHGCSLLLAFLTVLILASSFSITYFSCYDAEKKVLQRRRDLLSECSRLCDLLPKFSILVIKYEPASYYAVTRAKIARQQFYLQPGLTHKAENYFAIQTELTGMARKLKINQLALRDGSWHDTISNFRNITNRVVGVMTNYNNSAVFYNNTMKGRMQELWLRVLDFKEAPLFSQPASPTPLRHSSAPRH